MSRGINKVILIGNLGRDPEGFNGGCRLALATDESYKDKQTGQIVPKTEWHQVAAFGKLGEICMEWLKKGSKVYVEGRLQTDKYQKDGVDHYQTKIIANEMRILDSKPEGQQTQQGYQQPKPAQQPRQAPQPQRQQPMPEDDWSDDIPFN